MTDSKKRARTDSEASFLASYRADAYPRPSVTVDLVVFTIQKGALAALFIERGEHPYKGMLALPGGFLRVADGAENRGRAGEQGEDLDAAARRELEEETGLSGPRIFLRQLGAFGKPGRDPRTRIISIAYVALVRPELAAHTRAGGDAAATKFRSVDGIGKLAFDHAEILATARAFVQKELETSNIAFELVGSEFTIQDLRATYEIILGKALDPGNFRKRFLRMLEDGVVVETPEKRPTSSKPARVYRFAAKPQA